MIDMRIASRDVDANKIWDSFEKTKNNLNCFVPNGRGGEKMDGIITVSSEDEYWKKIGFRDPSFFTRITMPYPEEIKRAVKPPLGSWTYGWKEKQDRELRGAVFCWEDDKTCFVVENTSVETIVNDELGYRTKNVPETRYYKFDCPEFRGEMSPGSIPIVEQYKDTVNACMESLDQKRDRLKKEKVSRSMIETVDLDISSMHEAGKQLENAVKAMRQGKMETSKWIKNAKEEHLGEVMGDSLYSSYMASGISRAIHVVENAVAGKVPDPIDFDKECK